MVATSRRNPALEEICADKLVDDERDDTVDRTTNAAEEAKKRERSKMLMAFMVTQLLLWNYYRLERRLVWFGLVAVP